MNRDSCVVDVNVCRLRRALDQFAMSPFPEWKALAWTGALLITAFVLVLSIVARLLVGRSGDRHTM